MLSVKDVVVRFGGVVALDGPTFEVAAGEICGLIGPNGAGKTTLFNCISRLADPDEGSISFEGEDLLARAPHEIAPLGIARTFQNLGLAHSLTVRENVMLGGHHTCRGSFLADGLGLPGTRRAERELRELADRMLARLDLATSPTAPPSACPTARSSASSSPARCARARSCCCSTSRPAGSATARSRRSPTC